jgi:hypothetical protein
MAIQMQSSVRQGGRQWLRRTTARRVCARQVADRLVPLLLLLVLELGLSITTFTHGWIGALPYHDHLYLEAIPHSDVHAGALHHTHPGDALDQAFQSLTFINQTGAQAGQSGVVSLLSLDLNQFDLSTFTFTGAVVLGLLALAVRPTTRLPLAELVYPAGQCPAPLAPPPQSP